HTHALIILHRNQEESFNSFLFTLLRRYWGWKDAKKRGTRLCFPEFKFVFPKAPEMYSERTRRRWWLGGWRRKRTMWFDVWDEADPTEKEELQIPGLKFCIPQIIRLIQEEAQLLGGDTTKIILAGLEDGGGIAAHVLFNCGFQLGAVIGYCSGLPLYNPKRDLKAYREMLPGPKHKEQLDEAVKKTPILLEYSLGDEMVTLERAREMRNALIILGCEKVKWNEYEEDYHMFRDGDSKIGINS
ncbi:hypothetical protein QBC38DRAFT_364828, partial [Podospora fimiseda]